jgi:hypothetical protein
VPAWTPTGCWTGIARSAEHEYLAPAEGRRRDQCQGVAGKAAPRGRYPHVKVVGEVNDFAGYNEVYGE